jgi:hypothetical protein
MTGSHVPHESLMEIHAVFMPDAMQPGHRYPLHFSWSSGILQFWQSTISFRHFNNGLLALVSLHHT